MINIRFPKPYVTQVIAYTSDACTRKCPYCIQKHNYKIDYDEDIIADVTNYFNANLVLNGRGETTLRPKRVESLYNKCPNIRRMFVYTNGDNESVREELSAKYPKIKWVKTFCQDSKDKKKHTEDRINTIGARNRMLVSPNTDLGRIDFDYFHPENEYILLSTPEVISEYEGSVLQKFLKSNPEYIPQLVDIQSFIFGDKIDCWCDKITIDDNCTYYKKFHNKNDLFKSRMDFIQDSYEVTLPIIKEGRCNVFSGLHKVIIKDHPNYNEFLDKKNIVDKLYSDILGESVDDLVSLPIVMEISENFNNPIKWSASIANEEFDDKDKWYESLFNSQLVVTELDKLLTHSEDKLLNITLINNELYDITITGKQVDLLKLFSNPTKYNLANSLFTKLFKYTLKKITQ